LISGWARKGVEALAAAGVLPVNDALRPRDNAKRGEVALLFKKFLCFVMEG
jgi:hypothetical protein